MGVKHKQIATEHVLSEGGGKVVEFASFATCLRFFFHKMTGLYILR